jgi:predicted enzyme related to lactoylglutathione lyase
MEASMKLKFLSVMVVDQEHALQFYTSVLGFQKMADMQMGSLRWLTVTSPDGIEGVELVLEPVNFEPALIYQKALFEAGIPAIALITTNLNAEVARLKSKDVIFRGEPKEMGPITSVVFEDTCGNLINLVQPAA